MTKLFELRWSILFAALVGAMAAGAGQAWWRGALNFYDEVRPVVEMTGALVSRDGDSVLLSVRGEKLRACTYLRIQGYTRGSDGRLTDAYVRREDHPERGDTKPLGVYSIGDWRVWPVAGAIAVLLYSQHDCDGRVVITKLAEVEL